MLWQRHLLRECHVLLFLQLDKGLLGRRPVLDLRNRFWRCQLYDRLSAHKQHPLQWTRNVQQRSLQLYRWLLRSWLRVHPGPMRMSGWLLWKLMHTSLPWSPR